MRARRLASWAESLVAALTYPGAVVHEAIVRLFGASAGVSLYHVTLFHLRARRGLVLGEPEASVGPVFAVTIAAWLAGSLLAMALAFPLVVDWVFLGGGFGPVSGLFAWLALSLAFHTLPSHAFAKHVAALGRLRDAVPWTRAASRGARKLEGLRGPARFFVRVGYAVLVTFVVPVVVTGVLSW